MSHRTITTILTLAGLLLVVGLPAAAAPSDPFVGAWQATDTFDDSDMTLSFGGQGETRSVRLFDDLATGGVCEDEDGPALARGSGEIDGDTIAGTWDVECLNGPGSISDAAFEFEHDAQTDTLEDDMGNVWTRPGR